MSDCRPHSPFSLRTLDRRTVCRDLALAGVGVWLSGCRREATTPRLLDTTALDPAQLRYGIAPAEGDVRYQPDVVLVRGGPTSILGMGNDGLTWILDAGARGVSRMRAGSIALVTDRCAGRVLALHRSGDAVIVVLGPAELTDFIRDCDLQLEQPVDFSRAAVEAVPAMPGTDMQLSPVAPWTDREADEELASLDAWKALQSRPQFASTRQPLRMNVIPEIGAGGVGIRTALSNNLVNIEFVARLRLPAPQVRFHLRIAAGKVEQASLQLSGAAGLRLGFVATSSGNYSANIDSLGRLVPVALSLPIILNVGSPLSLSLHQRFLVRSGFSASQSVLKAIGDWGLAGDLHFGYRNGRFGDIGGPVIQSVNNGIIDGMRGISVGVTGMLLSHQLRLLAGIGGLGFRVGPYVSLTSSLGVSHGSSLARPVQPNVCRSATLAMHVAPGIGWQIPQLIADGVNAILGLLRIRKIQSTGGVHSEGVHVFKRTVYAPDTPLCREAAGGGPASPSPGGGPPPPSEPPPPRASAGAGARSADAPQPGETSGSPSVDLGAACRDLKLRRQLEQAGLDMRQICRDGGKPV